MANVVNTQIIMDGNRNAVVKVTGVLDTSNVAASGPLGTASSGVTTLNSKTITFTAGGLTPIVGQGVTGTGIPAGAYVASVTSTTAVVLNVAATANGSSLTFSLVAGSIIIIDPVNYTLIPTGFRIDHLDYSISDPLEVRLLWDGSTQVDILPIAGRGKMSFFNFGGLQNNAPSATGRIALSTAGYNTTIGTTPLVFSVVLELVKQGVQ